MNRYRIFYHDGSTADGGEDDEIVTITLEVRKSWLESPQDGVQAIVYENERGEIKHRNASDYYYPLGDGFNGCNDLAYALRTIFGRIIKFGLTMPPEEYQRIEQAAKDFNWRTYQEKVKPYRNGEKTLD